MDSDGLATCPYDERHKVRVSKLQYHIIKCGKDKPPLAICDFNNTHRMSHDLIREHMRTCPDNPALRRTYNDRPERHGRVRKMVNEDIKPLEEYWD